MYAQSICWLCISRREERRRRKGKEKEKEKGEGRSSSLAFSSFSDKLPVSFPFFLNRR